MKNKVKIILKYVWIFGLLIKYLYAWNVQIKIGDFSLDTDPLCCVLLECDSEPIRRLDGKYKQMENCGQQWTGTIWPFVNIQFIFPLALYFIWINSNLCGHSNEISEK